MRLLTATFLVMTGLAGAAAAADIPGRVSFGFNAGGAHSANDHERLGANGTGYCYFGEVAYEPTIWLVAPQAQWGYAYTSSDLPPGETGGYVGQPDALRGAAMDLLFGARVRVPLWETKLRPYAGPAVTWTNYHRQVTEGDFALVDDASAGWGWAALGGLEFFPDAASGFSICLEYRYAATNQKWRKPPPSTPKGGGGAEFGLTEKLITFGVKVYAL
jgi:hypothetical protein